MLSAIKSKHKSAQNNTIAVEYTNKVAKINHTIGARKRSIGLGAVGPINTVGIPPTASADMGGLLNANASAPEGSASCVGHIAAANRIVTNGTMVTGIIADTTAQPIDNRACDPAMPLEKGINLGNSGIDPTWDYGK